jgi:hypothetical protein
MTGTYFFTLEGWNYVMAVSKRGAYSNKVFPLGMLRYLTIISSSLDRRLLPCSRFVHVCVSITSKKIPDVHLALPFEFESQGRPS